MSQAEQATSKISAPGQCPFKSLRNKGGSQQNLLSLTNVTDIFNGRKNLIV